MLAPTEIINFDEVRKRHQEAQKCLDSFKGKVRLAVLQYQNSWSYRLRIWIFGLKHGNKDARDANIADINEILNTKNTTNELATALSNYIDGPKDHFGWAWFSPLKSYVRDAVEHYAERHQLHAIDRDLALFAPVPDSSTSNILSSLSRTTTLPEIAKTINDLQQSLQKSEAENKKLVQLVQTKNSEISSLAANFSRQILSFKSTANTAITSFGTLIASLLSNDSTPQNDSTTPEGQLNLSGSADQNVDSLNETLQKTIDALDQLNERENDLDNTIVETNPFGELSQDVMIFSGDVSTQFADLSTSAIIYTDKDIISQLRAENAELHKRLEATEAALTAEQLKPAQPLTPQHENTFEAKANLPASSIPEPPAPPPAPPMQQAAPYRSTSTLSSSRSTSVQQPDSSEPVNQLFGELFKKLQERKARTQSTEVLLTPKKDIQYTANHHFLINRTMLSRRQVFAPDSPAPNGTTQNDHDSSTDNSFN